MIFYHMSSTHCLVHSGVQDKRGVSEIDLSQPSHETAFFINIYGLTQFAALWLAERDQWAH